MCVWFIGNNCVVLVCDTFDLAWLGCAKLNLAWFRCDTFLFASGYRLHFWLSELFFQLGTACVITVMLWKVSGFQYRGDWITLKVVGSAVCLLTVYPSVMIVHPYAVWCGVCVGYCVIMGRRPVQMRYLSFRVWLLVALLIGCTSG